MARRPSWRLAAVVLVALIGLSALAALVDDDPESAPDDPPTGSAAFLEAWARSRSATFRSVSEFSRISNSTDAELTDRVVVAQRPPDRLTIDQDGALGLISGFYRGWIDNLIGRIMDVFFSFPSPDMRAELWRRTLPKERSSKDIDFDALADMYELSGGFIKVACERTAYVAGAALGAGGRPVFDGPSPESLADAPQFELLAARVLANDVRLDYGPARVAGNV